MPTAQICLNKSRLKVYHKEKTPTYYLSKGQEFQIELFNPTKDTILAKIFLNGKAISQGGLVLRPAQRVFLERYLDVAKKFLFDTYEVANTAESIQAIEDNGDFKVEFYKESTPLPQYNPILINNAYYKRSLNDFYNGNTTGGYVETSTSNGTLGLANITSTVNTNYFDTSLSTNCTLGDFNITTSTYDTENAKIKKLKSLRSKKTIETGRIEEGSNSNQQIKTVSKEFQYFPFHTLEYKMLPISQKVNTIEDINVKRYCHNCGAKQKPEFKFCPSCGKKV